MGGSEHVTIMASLARRLFASTSHIRSSSRLFSSSAPVSVRRSNLDEVLTADTAFEALEDYFDDNDTASAGHLMLRQQRQVLYYLRLIEHEMPKLVGEQKVALVYFGPSSRWTAYRKPFQPPTDATPLIVRQLDYAGEERPATAKRVIVASVDQLPLKDATAVHKFKLLAGPRWTPNPPADAGVSGLRTWDNGFVKISCEDFPKPAMNLKWASDALDRLIAEANVSRSKPPESSL